ncbi:MAG TPA: methylmalonyl-CoA mutase family protein, partial [Dehalococcoidales bacterium]|nr:methylmalonyl-CoA mutase family protein [Dehalococcoidales bacterium]
EYVARNTYFLSPAPSMRLVTDLCSFCAEKTPKWNSISISGYHMREAGCTAAQEIGFTLANAISYVEAMIARGMEVDSFAPQFSFFFGANNNVIEEVAKFRAGRRLWAKIMKERFGARNPRSMTLRFHAQTDGFTLSAQQPLNNVVRVTLQAFAAVLGGAQSLHTNSYNEALCLPTEEAVQLALRTQQIIAHESGATDTVDPLGGSYFMESLTDQIETGAAKYIETIDSMGGALKAIEAGYIQREINEVAYKYQKAVESGEQVVVGVNQYAADKKGSKEMFTLNPETEATQKSRLAILKRERDNIKVAESLARVKKAAAGNDNMMPVLIDAVRVYTTVGEISDALRSVFGEYSAPNVL